MAFDTQIFRSLEGKLALLALGLGLLAVFGSPTSNQEVTLNTRELAAIVENEVDHVTVQELADWLIQGAADIRLIDLGPADEYAEYHIPGAENVQLTGLLDYPLYRNERIILYSGAGIHSAQAWFLLKAHDYQGAYILLGGIESWKDEVLFPKAPENPTEEQLLAFRRRNVGEKGAPGPAWVAADVPGAPAGSSWDVRDVYGDGTRVVFVPFVH